MPKKRNKTPPPSDDEQAKKQNEISILISLFLKYAAKLPVKIFISSRYEEMIKDPFERAGSATHTSFLLHNIEDCVVEADIRQYMLEHLNESGRAPGCTGAGGEFRRRFGRRRDFPELNTTGRHHYTRVRRRVARHVVLHRWRSCMLNGWIIDLVLAL